MQKRRVFVEMETSLNPWASQLQDRYFKLLLLFKVLNKEAM